MNANAALSAWVDEVAAKTQPKSIVWCDGSDAENERLTAEMLSSGTLHRLDARAYPGCYLHRSHPQDVARTEHLTFISTEDKADVGPTNNWMSPSDAEAKVAPLFRGAMKGRTMYVVPHLMGPPGSPKAKVGVELTDSPYVVANMRIMTRMGDVALRALGGSGSFVKGLHSLGDLSPDRRFICHFPARSEIWSVGSGYGGNALLGKKCFALRIAGVLARSEGWLAEHMLIVGVQNPQGETRYLAAAFPSACGKTNLAMLVPPGALSGYKVWTVGDDIAWMWFDKDGQLRAINPEAGFFGVVPGTSSKTNPNALTTIRRNAVFTNVAVTPSGMPWWEGCDDPPPAQLLDWQGAAWSPQSGKPAAHPNSRFTVRASQCPSISPKWEDPAGVPISALVFGGRRARLAPLVYESFNWQHGVYVGASMASERTAAAEGKVGEVRRDPMAMIPFAGYNMADYFAHWLKVGRGRAKLPRIFHVNWFRTDAKGKYLWPGFGENLRVLLWILERSEGRGAANESPIGYLPARGGLNLDGLDLPQAAVDELLAVSRDDWIEDLAQQETFFKGFGERLPREVWEEHAALKRRLS
jgi:phosphoenolpyruvate carboxykinase (GTP)